LTRGPDDAVHLTFRAIGGVVREAGTVQEAFDGLKPLRTGEFALLEAEWPEMRAFIQSHEG
jgi:hypothetical protein